MKPNTQYDEEVVRLTKAGVSINDIAVQLRILPRQVSRIKERLKISKEYNGPLSAEQLARAESLLKEGMGYLEVARMTGHSGKTLSKYFPGMGMSASDGWQKGRINMKVKAM